MDLGQVREKINSVDDKLKQLFDERMECSNQVADVKIVERDKVFKPLREKEIVERFAGDQEYIAFVKKVMQISRKRQYGIFLDKVDAVMEELQDVRAVILEQGVLELNLTTDNTCTAGLDVNAVLSVISDTGLAIRALTVNESGQIKVCFQVDNNEKSIREAMVLAYMLSEETL